MHKAQATKKGQAANKAETVKRSNYKKDFDFQQDALVVFSMDLYGAMADSTEKYWKRLTRSCVDKIKVR